MRKPTGFTQISLQNPHEQPGTYAGVSVSAQIKVGDLVQVIKPTVCGCWESVGWIFQVSDIKESENSMCIFCFTMHQPHVVAFRAEGDCCDIHRLKRIPPLEELDDVKRDEEITA